MNKYIITLSNGIGYAKPFVSKASSGFDCIRFVLDMPFDFSECSLSIATSVCGKVIVLNENDTSLVRGTDSSTDKVWLDWTIGREITCADGVVIYQIMAYTSNEDGTLNGVWYSPQGRIVVGESIDTTEYETAQIGSEPSLLMQIMSAMNRYGIRTDSVEAELEQLQNAVDTIDGKADANSEDITENKNEIVLLKSRMNTSDENVSAHISSIDNPHSVTKEQLGLGNIDNTSDLNKPVSAAVQTALGNKVDKEDGKALSSNDYTDSEKSKLGGIESGAQVNTVTSVAGKTGEVVITKADVGLGNIDNTSDLNKPISDAAQDALDAKVDKSGFDDKVWNVKKQEQIGVIAPWGSWQADGIGICSTLTNSEFKAFGNVYFNYDGERISLKTSGFMNAQDNWLGNSEQYPYIYVYTGTDFDASNADETKFDYDAQFYILSPALSTIINQFDNKVYNAKGQGDRVGVNAPWGGWQADGIGICSTLTNSDFKALGNIYFNYDGERISLKTSDFTDAQDNWLNNSEQYPYIYEYHGTDFDYSNADENKFDYGAQFYVLGSALSEDINSREKSADKGVPNGYAPLDSSGLVPNKHLYNVLPYTTASGYPLSVSDHLDGENVIDYKVHGNSMQDGTPSPEAPIEIESTGDLVTDTSSEHYGKYDIPITVCGKNLFDYHQYTAQITQNGLTIKYSEDEQCFLINGTSAVSTNYFTKYLNIKITPNTYYSVSTRYVSGSINKTACTTEQKYTTVYFGKGDAANTITNWADCKLDITDGVSQNKLNDKNYITAVWFYIHPNIVFNNYKVKIQIEENKSATQYEQYTGETKHVYLDEPLRSVGDYSDYIDFKNQKVVRNITGREFSSTDNWSVYASFPSHFQVYVGDNYYSSVISVKAASNYYPGYKTSANSTPNEDYSVLSVDSSRIRFKDARYTTLAEWKAFLDTLTTPLTAYYILAVPKEEPLTVPEIAPQRSEVMRVSAAAKIHPTNIDVTYYQDITKVVSQLKQAIISLGGVNYAD